MAEKKGYSNLYYKSPSDLDDNAVVDLVRAMFQCLKEDYLSAIKYLDEHRCEQTTKEYLKAEKLKKECESFVRSPLYRSITDYDGRCLLRDFRKVG